MVADHDATQFWVVVSKDKLQMAMHAPDSASQFRLPLFNDRHEAVDWARHYFGRTVHIVPAQISWDAKGR